MSACIKVVYFKLLGKVVNSMNSKHQQTFPILIMFSHLSQTNGPFPFYMKFEKIQNSQEYHYSLKEHPMFSKVAKFGCEML